jgi:hypothetical protein
MQDNELGEILGGCESVTKVCRMCDVNVSILPVLRGGNFTAKSQGRLDREGIGSRKGLRLILAVSDLKSVEGFPREGFRSSTKSSAD